MSADLPGHAAVTHAIVYSLQSQIEELRTELDSCTERECARFEAEKELRAENAALRAALEPFARWYETGDRIDIDDLRRAREVLRRSGQ